MPAEPEQPATRAQQQARSRREGCTRRHQRTKRAPPRDEACPPRNALVCAEIRGLASAVYGRAPHYPIQMDVGALARGLGAGFVRASMPGDLVRAADLLRNPRGPIVVDVLIDPDVRMPKKDRMAAMGPAEAARVLKLVN